MSVAAMTRNGDCCVLTAVPSTTAHTRHNVLIAHSETASVCIQLSKRDAHYSSLKCIACVTEYLIWQRTAFSVMTSACDGECNSTRPGRTNTLLANVMQSASPYALLKATSCSRLPSPCSGAQTPCRKQLSRFRRLVTHSESIARSRANASCPVIQIW
jgi:hypothetical protein